MNQFGLDIRPKTKLLNLFRRAFRFKPFEELLVRKIENSPSRSVWERLSPPNYLYRKPSMRRVERSGIKYSLDISDTVEHSIYFGYKDKSHEELFRLAASQRLIIDIGANIGSVSMTFSRICPDAKIFAFEPDSKNYEKARNNLSLNQFPNITLINKGLGDRARKAKLYKVNEANEGMNRILDDSSDSHLSFDEIEIMELDEFVKTNHLENVDLIKIDVEGYELKVLKGASSVLERDCPTLFIELDDQNLRAQNDSAESLVSFLEDRNYQIYRADNGDILSAKGDFTGCHFDIVGDRLP